MAGAPGGGQEDDEDDAPPGVPPGSPFYMSPEGHAALSEEARRRWQEERPRVVEVVSWAASRGDRSENADYQYGKRRLRQIDERIRFLLKRIEAAEAVDTETPRTGEAATTVFFGDRQSVV